MGADNVSETPDVVSHEQILLQSQVKQQSIENGRIPLAPSERNSAAPGRKPRNREVTSRYKSIPPPPCRFPSPNLGRNANVLEGHKRAISAERKRPATPGAHLTVETKGFGRASDDTLSPKQNWSVGNHQTATLEVNGSDERENHILGFSLGTNGGHTAPDSDMEPQFKDKSEVRFTPDKARIPVRRQSAYQIENNQSFSEVYSKLKWPSGQNSKTPALSKSMDMTVERDMLLNKNNISIQSQAISSVYRVPSSTRHLNRQVEGNNTSSRGVSRRLVLENRIKHSSEEDGRMFCEDVALLSNIEVRSNTRQQGDEAELADCDSCFQSDSASDSELESVGDAATIKSLRGSKGSRPGGRSIRGTQVPARFWQDLGTKVRRLSDGEQVRSSMPESELCATGIAGSKVFRRPKIALGSLPGTHAQASSMASGAHSPGHGVSSSLQTSLSPSSLNKSLQSPVRTRALAFQTSRPTPYGALNLPKNKKAMNQQEENAYYRVLHNRWLQWRFVNAKADSAMASQRSAAERSIYSAWKQTGDLRDAVISRRIELQKARNEDKLKSLLLSQEKPLKEWEVLEQEHSSSLTGTIEALEAAVLRVPITGGAKANAGALKQAISVALDMMDSIEQSTKNMMPSAEKVGGVISQLAEITSMERTLLADCANILDRVSSLEVEERSLRLFLIQLEYERTQSENIDS